MFDKTKIFFSRTPEGKECRQEVWEDYGTFVTACACLLAGALATGYALSLLSDTVVKLDAAVAKYDTCEAARKVLSDKDVDFEGQEREVEKAKTDLAAKQVELATAQAEVEALKKKVDTDHDGKPDIDDQCPNTVFLEGGPSTVNSFGCSEMEAADSCKNSSDRIPGQFEQYIWSDCPLSDQENTDYTCTAAVVNGVFKVTECHETPYNLVNGVKSYGG